MKIFTPYRVCPLGAHVDHQHGVVTGFAIDMVMRNEICCNSSAHALLKVARMLGY